MITIERYTATWCSPCSSLAPVLQQIQQSYTNDVNLRFTVIDIDEQPEKVSSANVRGVPTVIIYKDGVELNRFVGVHSRNTYVNAINASLE
jgi:thioredoxin 1